MLRQLSIVEKQTTSTISSSCGLLGGLSSCSGVYMFIVVVVWISSCRSFVHHCTLGDSHKPKATRMNLTFRLSRRYGPMVNDSIPLHSASSSAVASTTGILLPTAAKETNEDILSHILGCGELIPIIVTYAWKVRRQRNVLCGRTRTSYKVRM